MRREEQLKAQLAQLDPAQQLLGKDSSGTAADDELEPAEQAAAELQKRSKLPTLQEMQQQV